MKCQRIFDNEPDLVCNSEATHTDEVFDKMLGIKVEVRLCSKHHQEYNVKSANARTNPRKRKTQNYNQ
jgi:hypothetical protein